MDKSNPETTETSKKSLIDFGELRNDTDFITKSTNLENVSFLLIIQIILDFYVFLLIFKTLNAIDEHITAACDFPNYDDLSTEEKVKFDLYLSYSINSLYWMYCKLQAIDTASVLVISTSTHLQI